MKYNVKKNKISWIAILLILLLSHITVNTYVPSLLLNYAGIILVAMVSIFYVNQVKNEFQILLSFYVLSHFSFAASQGGLFNLVFLIVLIFSRYLKISKIRKSRHFPLVMTILFFHILGSAIKSPAPLDHMLMGTFSIISYMAMFLFASTSRISKEDFGQFIKISTIMITWMLFSQLNSRYALITISSPLVSYSDVHNQAQRFFRSMMGSSPLTAEYAFIHFVLGLGLFASIQDLAQFELTKKRVMIYTTVAFIVMVLTTNRSTVFVGIAAILAILFKNTFKISRNTISLWLLVIIITLFAFTFKDQLGIDILVERLQIVEIESMTLESIESGESINRSTAFDLGKDMISRENWWVGYGWSTHRYNRIAWFGADDFYRADPHSLYYALPMLFGWLGTIAFLLMIMSPVFLGLSNLLKRRHTDSDQSKISWLYLLIMILFFINEIKQGFITNNYFMIMMFWIGIANSVQKYGFTDSPNNFDSNI